ncbi:MAG TPA: UDP-N-acetylmuramoyl-tripeptide--D-alanyl-D-alanine ligase [Solirubrobacteraceae bacterium]|jgi:UDP-N-acetylmuramoyl-tripeptide--D-alanyl-D-alanine ligase
MRSWDARRVAGAAGARLLDGGDVAGGPTGVAIDSRELVPGDLFIGLRGADTDGGRFAAAALAGGAWGVLATTEHVAGLSGGVVMAAADPLLALHSLARGWRRHIGARVVAITGSTGKTSTKDILAALLGRELRTVASPLNRNTEIGLPLAVLDAGEDSEALVLELAMRGAGQIAQLTAICEPDVGVIVNVGPAHLELLGSLEAIAAAKAELIGGLRAGTTAVLPAVEPLLEPFARDDIEIVRFGAGGDVELLRAGAEGVVVSLGGRSVTIEPGFRAAHLLSDMCAALAAAQALGVAVEDGPLEVSFSGLRGERLELPGGVLVINDCYNANPMSMRAALEELATMAAGRRVAVLGDMLELGSAEEERFHRALGEQASAAGVELLVTVGPRAAWTGETFAGGEHHHVDDANAAAQLLRRLLAPGDTVLVKGSRGVALERVAVELGAA